MLGKSNERKDGGYWEEQDLRTNCKTKEQIADIFTDISYFKVSATKRSTWSLIATLREV